MAAKYKTWMIQVPERLYIAAKIYSVTSHKKIVQVFNEAVELYVRDVESKKINPVEDFNEIANEKPHPWSIQLDHECYKSMKRLCIDHELKIFQAVSCMLLHYLREQDALPGV